MNRIWIIVSLMIAAWVETHGFPAGLFAVVGMMWYFRYPVTKIWLGILFGGLLIDLMMARYLCTTTTIYMILMIFGDWLLAVREEQRGSYAWLGLVAIVVEALFLQRGFGGGILGVLIYFLLIGGERLWGSRGRQIIVRREL